MKHDFFVAIAPVELIVGLVRRSARQLLVGHVDLVGVERGAVFHPIPRDRIVFGADTHDAAETEHRVCDLATDLIDHKPLNGADLGAV